MEKIIYSTNMYFNRIDKKLDVIFELIQKTQTNSASMNGVDTIFLKHFPVNEIETLKILDDKFKTDSDFKSKLVGIYKILLMHFFDVDYWNMHFRKI